jgi:hypothetical protein
MIGSESWQTSMINQVQHYLGSLYQLQRNENKKQFIELSLKSLV